MLIYSVGFAQIVTWTTKGYKTAFVVFATRIEHTKKHIKQANNGYDFQVVPSILEK